MKRKKIILALILLLSVSFNCLAAADLPPSPRRANSPFPGLDDPIPLDSNITILIVLGVMYGVYKLVSSRKTLNN